MPARPAWPSDSGIRLFVDKPLTAASELVIEGGQAHYLIAVMRLKPGCQLTLFDDRTGEWRAQAVGIGKRDVTVRTLDRIRPREAVPDLWLAAAPIRKARYDWVAEKACELGVDRFVPVLTRRCVADKVKPDRLRLHMIEAAEQCGRTALPHVVEAVTLAGFLASVASRTLFFADEAGGPPIRDAVAMHPGPAAILIGPEGGFDDAERAAVLAHPSAIGMSLGPRILRADTAAAAAVATWMAFQDQ